MYLTGHTTTDPRDDAAMFEKRKRARPRPQHAKSKRKARAKPKAIPARTEEIISVPDVLEVSDSDSISQKLVMFCSFFVHVFFVCKVRTAGLLTL